MVISFKLETDPDLLIEKAKIALDRYHHDLVIGNILTTRKFEVVFVAPGRAEEWIRLPGACENGLLEEPEIEALIVPAVVRLHEEFIQSYQQKLSGVSK
jgi:phosphopantothenate-cysteine ligase